MREQKHIDMTANLKSDPAATRWRRASGGQPVRYFRHGGLWWWACLASLGAASHHTDIGRRHRGATSVGPPSCLHPPRSCLWESNILKDSGVIKYNKIQLHPVSERECNKGYVHRMLWNQWSCYYKSIHSVLHNLPLRRRHWRAVSAVKGSQPLSWRCIANKLDGPRDMHGLILVGKRSNKSWLLTL